jgi:O-antigen/teichoic acid export membrane protein
VSSLPAHQTGSSPARASLWFGVSLYVNGALLFLATPIFTRLLSTSEYGEVVLYASWAAVLGIFATLSLSGGVFPPGFQR